MTPANARDEDALGVHFTELRPEHFERLRDWLNTPHVYEWWGADATADGLGGPGDRATTLEAVAAEYLPEIERGGPAHFHLIVVDATPVGMIQWYPLAAYPDYAAEIGELDAGTAGVDLLIGDVAHVGRGLGTTAIAAYVETVVFSTPGIVRCVGAPDVRNTRSIRAFEKAGFRFVRDAPVTGEAAPEHVMVRERGEVRRPTIRP